MMTESKVNPIYPETQVDVVASSKETKVQAGVAKEELVIAEYRLRLASLTMIKQLMHLCRDVQTHRGLGMGLLAGNREFGSRFALLQQQMERRIQALFVFSREPNNPFSENDANKINEAWFTIRDGWYDDSVLENFQFHNYFIEQLLQMVTPLSRCLQSKSARRIHKQLLGVEPPNDDAKDNAKFELQDELLLFICYQLPKMVEFLGMVRALASHAASLGHYVEEHDKKLKYLCQCVQTEKLLVVATAEKLHQIMGADIPSLLVLQTYAFKVDAFVDRVLKDVISQEQIRWSSDDLFSMATEIMDIHWRVVDDGINLIQQHQDETLETWFLKG